MQYLSYDERLFLKYDHFVHTIEILKSNLYPTNSIDFPDFVPTSASSLDFSELEIQNTILALDCEMVLIKNNR